ncbi:hypothetical protein DRQ26_00455 [bacterium]|nr:MAG: hypothetical protein DRQ26_00455 [bacterium]
MKRAVLLLFILIFLFGVPIGAQEENLNELSLEELLDVKVVSSAQNVLRITQAPSVIRVITAEEIRQRGYKSVGEALSSIPGIYVSYDHYNYNVCVRGISAGVRGWSRIIKVMIDNQPIAFKYDGTKFLGPELIPIDAVDRIEVVIGPGSTLYGPDAFLGVVNIVTKEGDDIDGVLAHLKVGSENEKDAAYGGELLFGRRTENSDLLVAISGFNSNRSGLKIPDLSPLAEMYVGMKSEDDDALPVSFYTKGISYNEKFGSIKMNASLQYLSSSAEFSDWGTLTHRNKISLSNYFGKLQWEKNFRQTLFTKLKFSYSGGGPNPDEQLSYGSDVHYERRDMGYSSIDVGAQLEYSPSEKIGLAIGTEYNMDNYNIETIWSIYERSYGEYHQRDSITLCDTSFTNRDTSYSLMGLYTQAVYRPSEQLSFTQGILYNVHNVYGDSFTARFGAVFNFANNGHLKLLFGSSFNVPTPNLLFAQPMYAGDVVGNPDLVPEKARTFDIELTPINEEDFSASFDVFYNLIDDKMGFVYKDGLLQAENCDNVGISGVEGNLRWSRRNFAVNWSVSYQHTQKRSSDEQNNGDDISTIDVVSFECPRLLSYSSVNYTIPEIRLNFNFEQKFVGERNASQPNIALNGGEVYKLGAYQVYNFTLSTTRLKLFKGGDTRFALSIKNLTDERYVEPGYNGVDIPGERRIFYINIIQRF